MVQADTVEMETGPTSDDEKGAEGGAGDTRWWHRCLRIPSYVWISLAIFAVLETLGVVGSAYYAGSVSNQNRQTAQNIALQSARSLEKLMQDQVSRTHSAVYRQLVFPVHPHPGLTHH